MLRHAHASCWLFSQNDANQPRSLSMIESCMSISSSSSVLSGRTACRARQIWSGEGSSRFVRVWECFTGDRLAGVASARLRAVSRFVRSERGFAPPAAIERDDPLSGRMRSIKSSVGNHDRGMPFFGGRRYISRQRSPRTLSPVEKLMYRA